MSNVARFEVVLAFPEGMQLAPMEIDQLRQELKERLNQYWAFRVMREDYQYADIAVLPAGNNV